jgi:hypothetical protein
MPKVLGNVARFGYETETPRSLPQTLLSITAVSRTVDGGQLITIEDLNKRFHEHFYVDGVTAARARFTAGSLVFVQWNNHARVVDAEVAGGERFRAIWAEDNKRGPAMLMHKDDAERDTANIRAIKEVGRQAKAAKDQKHKSVWTMPLAVTADGYSTPEAPTNETMSAEHAKTISELADLELEGDWYSPDPFDDVWLAPAIGMPGAQDELDLDPGYVRIGYVTFTVGSPVKDIQIREVTAFDQKQTLRSRTPIQKGNTHAAQVVTFTLQFDTPRTMNQVLLPLIRLFKRAPFLPVVNSLLEDHHIDALAFQGIQVGTMPQFPNSLQVTLTCWAFNWKNYLPSAESFDGQLCYPLLKLWAEMPQNPTQKNQSIPHFKPFEGTWTGAFQLYHGNETWLKTATEYPIASHRVSRWNNAVNVAQEAKRLHDQPTNTDLTGWEISTGPRGNDRSGEIREFVGATSRVSTSLPGFGYTDWMFLKLRDPLMVERLLLIHNDVVIFKGPVKLEYNRQELYAAGDLGATTNTAGAGWSLHSSAQPVSLDDFKQSLLGATRYVVEDDAYVRQSGPNDKQIEASIEKGYYTFAIPVGSNALRYLELQKPKTPPKKPSEFDRDLGQVFAPPSMTIESISAAVENLIAPMQMQGERIPTHQYMGGTATMFHISGTISNAAEASLSADFLARTNALARQYPGRLDGSPFGGFVEIENELAQFMGVDKVLPVQWSVETVPDFPDVLRFQLTLVEFDGTQRSKELLQALTEDLEKANKKDGINHLVRDIFEDAGRRHLRQAELKRRLRSTELYPDLCLPTHAQLQLWIESIKNDRIWNWETNEAYPEYHFLNPSEGGSGWHWALLESAHLIRNGDYVGILGIDVLQGLNAPLHADRFAEPDFYCAPCTVWGKKLVEGIVGNSLDLDYEFFDQNGDSVSMKAQQTMPSRPIQSKSGAYAEAERVAEKNKQGPEQAQIKPRGSAPTLYDSHLHGQTRTSPQEYLAYGTPLQFSDSGLVEKNPAAGNPDQKLGTVPRVASSNTDASWAAYKDMIVTTAGSLGLDPALLAALIRQESNFQTNAVNSSTGATGLGQTMPATFAEIARERGWTNADPKDPATGIIAAAHYLRKMLRMFKGDAGLALAAYNWGPGNVQEHGRNKWPKETQEYVKGVNKWWITYRNILGTGGAKLEVNREELRLRRMFENQYAYPAEVLDPWIQWSKSKKPEEQGRVEGPGAFVHPDWLFTFTDSKTAYVSAGTGGVSSAPDNGTQLYYSLKPSAVEAFVVGSKIAKFTQLPTHPQSVNGRFLMKDSRLPYSYQEVTAHDTLTPPTTPQEAFWNPTTGADMFHDLRREMLVGRLVGAFPTFYVALIDGGRQLRIWRLFDHIYGMMAVTSIQVHRTRKGPVETAVVSFSNMYHQLTAQTYETARQNADDPRGLFNVGWLSRTWESFFKITDETINAWNRHTQSLMLKPGARLHIRMGYGSDANHLPVVFNGTITSVPLTEGEVQVTALSDGIELLNDMAPNAAIGSIPVTRFNSYLGGGLNPRDLILLVLDPNSDWIKKKAEAIQFAFGQAHPIFLPYYRNEYGIEHFGYPQPHFMDNRAGEMGINLYNPVHARPVNETPGWEVAMQSLQLWNWNEGSTLIGVQISNATPWKIFDTCRKAVPDYICYPVPVDFRTTLFYGKQWFPLYGGAKETIDDIPQAGDPNAQPEKYFHRKTFQQIHLLHSSWNLIGTMVRADESGVATNVQAVGTYNGWLPGSRDMGVEQSWTMQFDSDIWTEKQKTRTVESGLYTTMQMKLEESLNLAKVILSGLGIAAGVGLIILGSAGGALTAITGIGAILGGASVLLGYSLIGTSGGYLVGGIARMFQSRKVINYYAAMTLKDHIKDMYQGPLIIQGSGWIKPYDLCQVQDLVSGLNGPCEVKEVIHTMSVESGFITEVTPDACVTFMDFDGQEIYGWSQMMALQLMTNLTGLTLMGLVARHTSNRIAVKGVRLLRDWLKHELKHTTDSALLNTIGRKEAERLLQSINDDINRTSGRGISINVLQPGKATPLREMPGRVANNVRYLNNLIRRGGSGNYDKINTLLTELVDEQGLYHSVFAKAPMPIRSVVSTTHGLRRMIGFSRESSAKVMEKGRELTALGLDKIAEGSAAAIAKFREQEDAARKTLQALDRRTVKGQRVYQLLQLKKKDLEALGDEAVNLVKEHKAAQRLLTLSRAGIKGAEQLVVTSGNAVRMGPHALQWLATSAGSLVGKAVVMSVITGLTDGLAQMILRWAISRQCLVMWPLKVRETILEAGINGHRGAVVGDAQSQFDELISKALNLGNEHWWAGFIPMVSNLAEGQVRYDHSDLKHKLYGDLRELENPDLATDGLEH